MFGRPCSHQHGSSFSLFFIERKHFFFLTKIEANVDVDNTAKRRRRRKNDATEDDDARSRHLVSVINVRILKFINISRPLITTNFVFDRCILWKRCPSTRRSLSMSVYPNRWSWPPPPLIGIAVIKFQCWLFANSLNQNLCMEFSILAGQICRKMRIKVPFSFNAFPVFFAFLLVYLFLLFSSIN